MKKYKNYVILGCIIIFLVIGLAIVSGIDTTSGKDNDIYESIEIYSVLSSDISSVFIKNEFGEYNVLYGDEIKISGKQIEKDDEKLEYLLTEISSMYASEIADENVVSLSDFGLLNPLAELELSLKDNSKIKIYIGNKTPTDSGYYVKLNDENKVYIVSTYSVDTILRKLDYYRNTVLFSFEISDINEFSYTNGTKTVSFKRNDSNDLNRNSFAAFNMKTPYDWAAESSKLEEVFNLLKELKIIEYVEDNPTDLSQYGLNPYLYKISLKDKNNNIYNMNIGSNVDGKYYIKMDSKNSVYLVDAKGFEFLDYEPTAFLQQFVCIRPIDNVATLSYIHNDINASFNIKKVDTEVHDVKYKGKLIDQKKFKEAYTEIISMKISGTLSYTPNTAPILEYTFTYTNSDSDTIKYYKYDDRKIAVAVNGVINFYVDISEFNMRINKIDDIIRNKI